MIEAMQAAIESIVRNVFPNVHFYGIYRYRIVRKNSGDERWILQVCSKQSRLPDALPISVWQGIAGSKADLEGGSEVLVSFIEGDPTKPIITHFCGPDMDGFKPVSLVFNADSIVFGDELLARPVARIGDMAGPFTITSASLKVRAE